MKTLKKLLLSVQVITALVLFPSSSTAWSAGNWLFSPATKYCGESCQTSDAGLTIIQQFEGFSPVAYLDAGGVPTIGYGRVIRKGEKFKEPMTPMEAKKILKQDVKKFERALKTKINVPLYQGEYDALISLVYNIGTNGSPTLFKFVNQNRHDDAAKQFLAYNKVRINGVLTPLRGLTRRRMFESVLYADARP